MILTYSNMILTKCNYRPQLVRMQFDARSTPSLKNAESHIVEENPAWGATGAPHWFEI